MKLLRLVLAVASIAVATAADEEALPDWMSIKIPVAKVLKRSTVAGLLAPVKAALAATPDQASVRVEIPEAVLAKETDYIYRASADDMSIREYLDLVVSKVEDGSHIWEKSENAVRYVPILSRTFPFTYEAWQKLEKTGKLSTERFHEMVAKSGLQLSKECQLTWYGSPKLFLLVKGRGSDIKALETLVSPIDGHSKQK